MNFQQIFKFDSKTSKVKSILKKFGTADVHCVPVCLCACVPMCLCAYVPMCLCAYVPMCLCAYVPNKIILFIRDIVIKLPIFKIYSSNLTVKPGYFNLFGIGSRPHHLGGTVL